MLRSIARWPPKSLSLFSRWQYICPGLTSGSKPVWLHILGASHFFMLPLRKSSQFSFSDSLSLYLLCQGLPLIYTSQCCSDLCFWIRCLSLVLVPQGSSFILTQFYKLNRKITGSEIITIIRESGPLVFWVTVSSLADGTRRKDGLRWPRPLSSQVCVQLDSQSEKQTGGKHMCGFKDVRESPIWILLCFIKQCPLTWKL